MEAHNRLDIATYVDWKLKLHCNDDDSDVIHIREKLLSKAGGIFLWVVLVLDSILRSRDEGKSLQYLLSKELDTVPDGLEDLFSQILLGLEQTMVPVVLRLFQWAVLATKPLRIHEWHHILAFIRSHTPSSLRDWRESEHFTQNDDQLEKQIKALSRVFVEIRTAVVEVAENGSDKVSIHAGAGSLDLEHGDTRVVQVIHESVRQFFLLGNGFYVLDPSLSPKSAIPTGHLSIINTCLDYMNVKELDALVQARTAASRSRAAAELPKPQCVYNTPNGCSPFLDAADASPEAYHEKSS